MQRTDSIDDTHLLEILRTKDTQIVELEAKARDHQKVIDLQENEIAKVKDEVTTYQQLLEVSVDCDRSEEVVYELVLGFVIIRHTPRYLFIGAVQLPRPAIQCFHTCGLIDVGHCAVTIPYLIDDFLDQDFPRASESTYSSHRICILNGLCPCVRTLSRLSLPASHPKACGLSATQTIIHLFSPIEDQIHQARHA